MNNVTDLLSKGDKLQKLSDEAVRDIYARQIILKIAKNRKGYIKESSELFKGLDTSEGGTSLYEAIISLDAQMYTRLNSMDGTIEEAILQEFTKDTSHLEDSKADIMRYKLKKTSECCGVPKAVLCHNNIEAWAETEQI